MYPALFVRGRNAFENSRAVTRGKVVRSPETTLGMNFNRAVMEERYPTASLGKSSRYLSRPCIEVRFCTILFKGVVSPRCCELKLGGRLKLVQSCGTLMTRCRSTQRRPVGSRASSYQFVRIVVLRASLHKLVGRQWLRSYGMRREYRCT